MEISFTTKEESNQKRQNEFLALSGIERVYAFMALSRRIKKFPTKHKPEQKNNFVIDFTKDENLGRKS